MKILQHDLLFSIIAIIGGISAVEAMSDGMEEQWELWPYFNESIRWRSDWIRWDAANATVREHFRAFRDFEAGGNSTIQRNTYLYDDERGTVSECRACGPWELDKTNPATSSPYGAIHPSRPYMRTLMLPDRSAAWLMRDLPRGGSPSGFELFLGDGGFLRLSVGVVYDATGRLDQVSAIREDSRDFDLFWTNATSLMKHEDSAEKENLLNDFWPDRRDYGTDGGATSFRVTVPGPSQESTQGRENVDLGSSKLNYNVLLEQDEVFEMPDGIILVCPSQLPTDDSGEFVIAAGWKKHDESWLSSIEARYSIYTMNELVYTVLDSSRHSSFPEDDDIGITSNSTGDVTSAANSSQHPSLPEEDNISTDSSTDEDDTSAANSSQNSSVPEDESISTGNNTDEDGSSAANSKAYHYFYYGIFAAAHIMAMMGFP